MTTPFTPGIAAGRLSDDALEANFRDLHAPYDAHEAAVAADRCYFCHDAPCVTACPTAIDIPLFIRQISTGMPEAAAETILEQNILGGMCARVCPTETLCEESCVRETAEGKPVEEFDGRHYVQERWLKADFALIKAELADHFGNLTYRMAARNFSPLMAAAATTTIVQATKVVEPGGIDPEHVHTPGIFVDHLV